MVSTPTKEQDEEVAFKSRWFSKHTRSFGGDFYSSHTSRKPPHHSGGILYHETLFGSLNMVVRPKLTRRPRTTALRGEELIRV